MQENAEIRSKWRILGLTKGNQTDDVNYESLILRYITSQLISGLENGSEKNLGF